MHPCRPVDTLAIMELYSIETYGELQPGLAQEWLLTNGLGGFAASSVVGCNTRRYHGLLCAATLPPVGRKMLLNRIAEIVTVDDALPVELAINQFNDRFHPRGDRYLRKFSTNATVRWEFDVNGVTIVKELQLLWQRNTAALRYTIDPGRRHVEFQLAPFVSLRDFHALRLRDGYDLATKALSNGVIVRDRDLTVQLRSDRASFFEKPEWWFGHRYQIEADRGQDCMEDLFTPGKFTMHCSDRTSVLLWASIDAVEAVDWDQELSRRKTFSGVSIAPTTVQTQLNRAAADFVVSRLASDGSHGTTVIAGYPWFADWGRDTMISLPGLLLTTRRFAEAGQVLSVFASFVSQGMVPNLFDDYTNEPQYNTVDASLWFIHAAYEFLRSSKDAEFFESHLKPACTAIIDGYARGTRYGIKMDPADGLITQGDATTQLTWMDAKTGDRAWTPRQGKAVEINALWYNALKLMGREDMAARVAASYAKAFWIDSACGLCDVVNEGKQDRSLRPNQIFAVSLPFSPLTAQQRAAVVDVVRRELLTPVGLRSLSQTDKNFHATYAGNQSERDQAYHNGTVWPWLLGAFLDAYLKVNDRSPAAIEQARAWMKPLIDSMNDVGCIGQISEIYGTEPPHEPLGCFAQAWSVAELLRLAIDLEM
jgi:predicted glycogen debranching enzyme